MESRILPVATTLCLLLTLTSSRQIISQTPTRTKSRINQFVRRHISIATPTRMWNYTHTPQYAQAAIARYNLRLQARRSINNAKDAYQNSRTQKGRFSNNALNDNPSIPVQTRNNWPFGRRRLSELVLLRTYNNAALNDDIQPVSRRRFSLHLLQKRRNGRRQLQHVTIKANRGRNIQILHNARNAKFIVNSRAHSTRLRIYNRNGPRVQRVVKGRPTPRYSDYNGLQAHNGNEASKKYQIVSSVHIDKSNAIKPNTHVIVTDKTIPISEMQVKTTSAISGSSTDVSTVTVIDSGKGTSKTSPSVTVHTSADPPRVTEAIARSTPLGDTSTTTKVPNKTTPFAPSTTSQTQRSRTNGTTTASRATIRDEPDLPDSPDLPDFIFFQNSD